MSSTAILFHTVDGSTFEYIRNHAVDIEIQDGELVAACGCGDLFRAATGNVLTVEIRHQGAWHPILQAWRCEATRVFDLFRMRPRHETTCVDLTSDSGPHGSRNGSRGS